MKILVTANSDSNNLSIENIVKEMIKRGHQVEIFARHTTPWCVRMFTALNLPIHEEKELTSKIISQFDVAFCCNDSMDVLRLADIYIFSYNVVMDTWITEGADFMFTMIRDRKLPCNEDCALMPIGNTKNDAPRICKTSEKQFLFIDAGHNPYGEKAKYQVANMLLAICHSYPEHKLVVKPRWLLNDTENRYHATTLHLYNILEKITNGNLPNNLILLNEHRDLQELIDESICVISTSITCFLDALLRGKGCIIVDGFDAEEHYVTRAAFRNGYDTAKQVGCCVGYMDVLKYLPDGLGTHSKYIQEQIAYIDGVSSRIIDVVEYIFDNFIKLKRYPAIKKYEYSDLHKELIVDPALTLEELKYKRFKNGMLYKTRSWVKINADIDYSEYYTTLENSYRLYPLTNGGYKSLDAKMEEKSKEIVLKNKDKCMKDAIDQSVIFQMLYESRRENEILDMPQDEILCTGPYHYFLGIIYKKQSNFDAALSHLCLFLDEANSRSFTKYPQENDWGVRNAYNYLFKAYNGENIPPNEFADLCIALYEQRNMTVVDYNCRKRAHNWLPKVAEQLTDTDPERALKCLRLYAKWEYHYNIRERDAQIKKISGAKLYRLGEGLKWLVKKLRGGVRCLREHGWKYTYHRCIEKVKNMMKNKTLYRVWDVFWNKVMEGYRLYMQFINKHGENAQLCLSGLAAGDAYIWGSIFDFYARKEYPNTTSVFGVYGKSGVDVAKLFFIPYVEEYSFKDFTWLWNLLMFNPNLHIEAMHHHPMYYHIRILFRIEGLHQFNFRSLAYAYLGVGDDNSVPPTFCENQKILQQIFDENGLIKGKTVLLAPYAKSTKQLPLRFWEYLATELSKCGFCVCTNSIGAAEPPIQGTREVFIPFANSVPFLEMAGAAVGLRSGFQDVTVTANCLKVVLYPHDTWPRGMLCSGNESFKLSAMYDCSDLYEVFYSPEKEEEIIKDISSSIKLALG